MNEVNLPAIEPVTDEDVMVAAEESEKTPIGDDSFDVVRAILEQDRRRVAERQAARPLEKINCDESYGRSYIPVAPGWEVQTKGKGSTFRLCEPSGDRLAVPDSPYLHATIERMALAIHAHRVAMEEEVERLRAEVAAHRKHDVLRCDALMKAEAEVAKLNAACAAKDAALRVLDVESNSTLDSVVIAAALALDGGSNYIDASGAVEARLHCEYGDPSVGVGDHWFLTDNDMDYTWAGSKVKIVRVAK